MLKINYEKCNKKIIKALFQEMQEIYERDLPEEGKFKSLVFLSYEIAKNGGIYWNKQLSKMIRINSHEKKIA